MRTPFILCCCALLTVGATAQTLTTTFTNNNGGSVGGAVYFDLNITNPAGIAITSIDLNSNSVAGTGGAIDIYTAQTYTGNSATAAAWTLVSAANPIVSAGPGLPSAVPLTSPLILGGGVNYGIALVTTGVGHAYTNGANPTNVFSNADLSLTAGEASNVPFTAPIFTPRVVNCNINYTVGAGGTGAVNTSFGVGCIRHAASIYELFAPATSFDLNGVNIQWIPSGQGGYIVSLGGTYVPPSPSAIVVNLVDDGEITAPLTGTLSYPGGTATTFSICSNGFISVGPGASNGTNPTPTAAGMLSAARTAWWCWHDYDPSIATAGAGRVKFERVGTVAYTTWEGVWDFGGTTTASANTLQWQIDTASGIVTLCVVQLSGAGNEVLVGYSPGGPSLDLGPTDLSAVLPASVTLEGTDTAPLTLAALSRPLIGTGWNLDLTRVPAASGIGFMLIGLSNPNAPLGPAAPGCTIYSSAQAAALLLFPPASPTFSLALPNNTRFLGTHLFAQGAALLPGANLLGGIGSNGIDGRIGNL